MLTHIKEFINIIQEHLLIFIIFFFTAYQIIKIIIPRLSEIKLPNGFLIKLGKLKKERRKSIVYDLETIYYNKITKLAFLAVKDEVRARVKENGFYYIKDFTKYKTEAIKSLNIFHTQFIDDHYFQGSSLLREEVYNENVNYKEKIENLYSSMFDGFLEIATFYTKQIQILTRQKEDLINKPICEDGLICHNAEKVYNITMEIMFLKEQEAVKKMMKEAERTLSQIEKIYYSAYLKLLKN